MKALIILLTLSLISLDGFSQDTLRHFKELEGVTFCFVETVDTIQIRYDKSGNGHWKTEEDGFSFKSVFYPDSIGIDSVRIYKLFIYSEFRGKKYLGIETREIIEPKKQNHERIN